jgi:hypothetical protein
MTLPANGALVLAGATSNSINNEFGYGTDLGSYRNKLYTNSTGTTLSSFPLAPNSISFNNFYSTTKIPSGSATYTTVSTSASIPAYNTLTITIYGGSGGGGGGSGFNGCNNTATAGAAGGNGTSSSIGYSDPPVTPLPAWASFATGGRGGSGGSGAGTNGANGTPSAAGDPLAPQGGGGNGSGGTGGKSVVVVTNPLLGGSGPPSFSTTPVSVGTLGGGGAGGANSILSNNTCYPAGSGSNGSPGQNGYITISWS